MGYRCFRVERDADGKVVSRVAEGEALPLAEGWCEIRLDYSAINYKDCLAAAGHPGVARKLPLVPGIDGVGTVSRSKSPAWSVGQRVIVAHAEFGTSHDGGFAEYAYVPSDWLIAVPDTLSAVEAAAMGTAGFTAAQCCEALLSHGVAPQHGPVVVSGATGGVGIFAVKLLSRLGYHVVASTGKPERHDWLKSHGAAEVIGRDDLNERSGRPLLSARWAGAVDTVGGNCLATILRGTRPRGCVAACGLVGGAELAVTVYPFILRGVVLAGIDSAGISGGERTRLWHKLGTEWRLDRMEELYRIEPLEHLPRELDHIRDGKASGRVVIDLRKGNG